VDENGLSDIFSPFGTVESVAIVTDRETGRSRGFGFVSFETFEASDTAIEAMNGQFLCKADIANRNTGRNSEHSRREV
jgi:splicing factor 3B subunit 4